MTPKPFYSHCPELSSLFLFFYLLISSLLLLLLLLLLLFLKFTYSGTEDYIKESSDDDIVNLGSPPSERYTVTNLVPHTFYNFYFHGISSCGQSLSQILRAKTFASGKLRLISYLYVFLLHRKNCCHPI